MMYTHIIQMLIESIILIFSVANFRKYKHVRNGANATRILFFLTFICFSVHSARLAQGYSEGHWFTLGLAIVAFWFLKYYVKLLILKKINGDNTPK